MGGDDIEVGRFFEIQRVPKLRVLALKILIERVFYPQGSQLAADGSQLHFKLPGMSRLFEKSACLGFHF